MLALRAASRSGGRIGANVRDMKRVPLRGSLTVYSLSSGVSVGLMRLTSDHLYLNSNAYNAMSTSSVIQQQRTHMGSSTPQPQILHNGRSWSSHYGRSWGGAFSAAVATSAAVTAAITSPLWLPHLTEHPRHTASCEPASDSAPAEEDGETVVNWSGTHEVKTKRCLRPETLEELERIVREANERQQRIRPLGSGLSPNGIALCQQGMVNLALMDAVLLVDEETGRVTVQAGARVQQVVEALRPHGLTLQNYASVREQQIGGFIQVGAHGTGARIPPVDEQVVALKIVTPGRGTLHLTADSDPELFYFARCGLGGLGVVAEVTLQAVKAHKLREETLVTNMQGVRENHSAWMSVYQHLRYMWIPHTDAVVVVRSNPIGLDELEQEREQEQHPKSGGRADSMGAESKRQRQLFDHLKVTRAGSSAADVSAGVEMSEDDRLAHLQALYTATVAAKAASRQPLPASRKVLSGTELRQLGFTELRDELLALDPLDCDHVVAINQAEALYWRMKEGVRIGWSDEILGFDCGGQQWVSEICFQAQPAAAAGASPTHTATVAAPELPPDLSFMADILSLIRSRRIAAPAPIEQRWSSGSRSFLSPATGAAHASGAATAAAAAGDSASGNSDVSGKALQAAGTDHGIYSWVGIIMYLPSSDPIQRVTITDAFMRYKWATAAALWDKYGAHEHWAKIEVPSDPSIHNWLTSRLARDFPVARFNWWRRQLDPNGILSNDLLDALLPTRK